MLSTEILKSFLNELTDLVGDMSEDFATVLFKDVYFYCCYVMSLDGKLTDKELQVLYEVTGMKFEKKGIADLVAKYDWDSFSKSMLESLKVFILIDAATQDELDPKTSKSWLFIGFLKELGESVAGADGKTSQEEKKIKDFGIGLMLQMEDLFKEAKQKFGGNQAVAGAVKNKKSQASTKADKSGSVTGTKGGNWIPMQEHIPTGNFLDDVFRDKRLTHEDRVKLWERLIGDSLPCINIADLQFKQPAWFGVDCANLTANQLYESGSNKANKPIYYYASGIASSSLKGGDMLVPAGLLVMHSGVVIVQESGGQMIPWDNIREIHDDGEDGMYVFSALSSNVDFGGVKAGDFKVHRVLMDVVEGTLDCIEENDYYEFYFPKKSYLKGITVPNQNELTALIKLINKRIEQIEPDRGSPSLSENPSWYTGLNYEETYTGDLVKKYNVVELCEDYLHNKGAKPGKADKSQPPKPDKLAQTRAETPQPQPVAPKPAAKAPGVVSVPTTGPTTKLDFWQALKPYIDQLRHKEFSQVKVKDDDCLDAKATVIVGVYNSILMRVSKKLLRLELYIDTETEAGNLQILDYIKAKIQVPHALKGRIEYERKEGRRAQRVCLSIPGFDLADRSCWAKYITELISVTDDFFDAVEAPMRDLIK